MRGEINKLKILKIIVDFLTFSYIIIIVRFPIIKKLMMGVRFPAV